MNYINWYKIAKLDNQDEATLNNAGYQLIDNKSFDQYELYLFKANPILEEMLKNYDIPPYQLGLQRKDTSFVNIEQQHKRNPPKNSNIPIKQGMMWIKETIENWVNQYGHLVAMSHSPEKNKMYKAILKRISIDYVETQFQGQNIIIL